MKEERHKQWKLMGEKIEIVMKRSERDKSVSRAPSPHASRIVIQGKKSGGEKKCRENEQIPWHS